ncbi:redoxin domain-containing protein [Rossellomorea sp. YC4-1]|nr:redoxin domain-containing protein [Rossellomorea sp. YC4-1]
MSISSMILWVIVIIQMFFMYRLTKEVNDFIKNIKTSKQSREKNITVGKQAPFFTTKNLADEKITLNNFYGKNTILLFTNSPCSVCDEVFQNFEKISTAVEGSFETLVIGKDIKKKLNINEMNSSIHFTEDSKFFNIFEIEVVPSLVIISNTSIIDDMRTIYGYEDVIHYINSYNTSQVKYKVN